MKTYSRRDFLKMSAAVAAVGMGATVLSGCAPTVQKPKEKKVVSVLGQPGLHAEVWKTWKEMILEDTKGEIELKYEPLGYAPIYAKVKSEAEVDYHTIDIIYTDSPWPEKLAKEGLLEPMPWDKMPNTSKIFPEAKSEFLYEVFYSPFGVFGFNQNFVKRSDVKEPVTWEAFLDPKWQGKVGWLDPRTFPTWVPAIVTVFGEDWIKYCEELDKNVATYYGRWVDCRIANQKGDVYVAPHFAATIYIGAVVDKAPMEGLPIVEPKPAWVKNSVSLGLVKNAPHRDVAIEVINMICDARYTKVLMDKGLNPSNHPDNYPDPFGDKILELFHAGEYGIKSFPQLREYCVPIDWAEWSDKVTEYAAEWEAKILKKRGA